MRPGVSKSFPPILLEILASNPNEQLLILEHFGIRLAIGTHIVNGRLFVLLYEKCFRQVAFEVVLSSYVF